MSCGICLQVHPEREMWATERCSIISVGSVFAECRKVVSDFDQYRKDCEFDACGCVAKFTWWCHQMETFSALLAFCGGIHWLPVNSLHKCQWRRALMFSLIFTWINGWVNNGEAGDLRCLLAHYDVTVMCVDKWWRHHGNENVFILMKLSSLTALEVVKMTTTSVASDENFIQMKALLFQWWNRNAFLITCPLWGEFTEHGWIPLTKDQWYRALNNLANLIISEEILSNMGIYATNHQVN